MQIVTFFHVGDCGPHFYVTCKIAFWLWRTIPFILIFIGTFGNILNIIVLSRRKMRKYSTNVYVLFLAITELTVLWIYTFPQTIYSITGYQINHLSPISCRLRIWIALTAAAFSTWILVLLTFERTLLTKFPVFSRNKLTPRNALIVSVTCLLIIATINSHVIFGFQFNNISVRRNATGNSTYQLPCDFSSINYAKFYTTTWSVIILVIHNILPAAIIIIGNFNIAAVILLQKKRLASVNPASLSDEANNVRKKSSTKILFILSAFYIATTTPWCIFLVVRGHIREPLSAESLAQWQLFTAIANILGWCNFSFNFFFYFVSGSLFKSEWNRLVYKAKNRFHSSRVTTTTTTTTRF